MTAKYKVITPVKDSLATTVETIRSISRSEGAFDYLIFDDFSSRETADYLDKDAVSSGYQVIHLRDHVTSPSPNYRTTLIMAQKKALEEKVDLIIVESDVIVAPETLNGLHDFARSLDQPGLVGSVTTDAQGTINFPYLHIKQDDPEVLLTKRSLSFCCTLIT
ncbi:MAG: glycosyltransferase family 2 protein, partial [Cyclobacteriaceae bacterium]